MFHAIANHFRCQAMIKKFYNKMAAKFKPSNDKNMINFLQLIDYNYLHEMHLENLLLDFTRLGLNNPDYVINPEDRLGRGFLDAGLDIYKKYQSTEKLEVISNVLNLLHLERVVIHFLPEEEIRLRGLGITARYKAFIGADYQSLIEQLYGFETKNGLMTQDVATIRNELDFMLYSLARGYINTPLRETARQNIWIYAFWMGLLQYFALFLLIHFYDLLATVDIPVSSLFVPFLGSIGACFAIKQKVEAMPETVDKYRNVLLLNSSLMGILFGLFRGAVAAVLLNIILVSQFIQGEIFPEFQKTAGSSTSGLNEAFGFLLHLDQYKSSEIAKILIWSLVAGYSERLIPDTIKKLSDSQSNSMQLATAQTINGSNSFSNPADTTRPASESTIKPAIPNSTTG